jgi:hypothetical protein
LDTYETERRAVAEAVLGLSTRIMKKYEDGAADAQLRTPEGKQVRLFDLSRGPHATTLGFGAATGYAIRRPEGPEIPSALVDVEGHAFTAYGAVPGAVVQVRPDGYVGAVRAAS